MAKSASNPLADARRAQNDQALKQELQWLLRRTSFNIINMDHGFSMTWGGKRLKFSAESDIPHDVRRYRVSGPVINGFLELTIGEEGFCDVLFIEADFMSGPTGRTIAISEMPFR